MSTYNVQIEAHPVTTTMDAVIERAIGPLVPVIENLYCRWKEESKYEDWSDYETVLQAAAKRNGLEFCGTTRKPFGIRVRTRLVAPQIWVWAKNNRIGYSIAVAR